MYNFFKNLFTLILLLFIGSAHANIVILGTRIIYPSDQKNITIQLQNKGKRPSLVQSWIDSNQENSDALALHTPFIITPPVSRIDPQTEQTLRIRYTGQELPQDRESLFYLNVKDIPAKPKTEAKLTNYLQFTFTSRLKLFFRPTTLPFPVEQAYARVSWHIDGKSILAKNPTPYYITYSAISIKQHNKQYHVEQPAMIAPFSEHTFSLPVNIADKTSEVHWRIINDYGGHYTNTSPLLQQGG